MEIIAISEVFAATIGGELLMFLVTLPTAAKPAEG